MIYVNLFIFLTFRNCISPDKTEKDQIMQKTVSSEDQLSSMAADSPSQRTKSPTDLLVERGVSP